MKEQNTINLFVPGRICLLGELSDLVAPYLSQNTKLIPGQAIAMGIDKGIYATAKKSETFIIKEFNTQFECEMKETSLKKIAKSNDFYAYICGVALYMMKHYPVKGLEIHVTEMTLPIKKGLSSSAAICVLIAKAYNQLYNLHLDLDEERKIAYEGEHLALSKCGRLDYICAIGKQLAKMTFYEQEAQIEYLQVKEEINLVIADLKGKKDTKKIMTDLNSCFPVAKNAEEKTVHKMVGIKNKELVEDARKCIENGNLKRLGEILLEAQKLIDDCDVVCSELKAPILHKTLNNPYIQSLTYGAKGMGSGGDGSIQLLAKNRKSQNLLITYINKQLGMDAFGVNISKN